MTTYIPALTLPDAVFLKPALSVLLPIGLGTAVGFSATRELSFSRPYINGSLLTNSLPGHRDSEDLSCSQETLGSTSAMAVWSGLDRPLWVRIVRLTH
jgi:hypothetical protein